MAGKQAAKLPKSMRNPLDALEMSGVLRDGAEALEKQAAQEGRSVRARPTVLRIYAFAAELEEFANTKLGDHESRLRSGG